MELSGYLAVARRWWWTLLVATWVAAVSGYVFASQIPPTYEARVQLLVGPYNTDTDTLRAAGQLVQTYAELITTEPLLASAIAEVGADMHPDVLAGSTRVVANDTTRFLTIRVAGTDPVLVRDLANALGDEISLLASRGTSRPDGQLQVVDTAKVPTFPIAPQVSLIVGLAAITALLGAMVLVMLIEYLSATVRTREDVGRLTNLPVLGQLDTLRDLPTIKRGLIDRIPNSSAAAAYRLVAAKVAFRDDDQPARSIIVVGTSAGSANAQVAANFAAVVARSGRNVIVVDADPSDAHLTAIYGLESRTGLADVLADSAMDLAIGLVRVSQALRIVPRGIAPEADTVDADRAASMLAGLREMADLVIVNTGPLHLSAGTLAWARAGDASVLVAVRDQSRRDNVTYAVESLRLVGVHARGAVLVDRRRIIGRGVDDAAGRAEPPASSLTLRADRPVEPATAPRTPSARTRARVSTGRPGTHRDPAADAGA